MKKTKSMFGWLNKNSGVISFLSPIVLAGLMLYMSQYFVTNKQYDADNKARIEMVSDMKKSYTDYQSKNEVQHEKMIEGQQDILKVVIKQADQENRLQDHEIRLRTLEKK